MSGFRQTCDYPWIKRKREFHEEIYADAEITSKDPDSGLENLSLSDGARPLPLINKDVSDLVKIDLVLDLLKEDTEFFQSIRNQLVKQNQGEGEFVAGQMSSLLHHHQVLSLRQDRIMTMIETKYPMWVLGRMGDSEDMTRTLHRYNLIEPCHSKILEECTEAKKGRKEGRVDAPSIPMAFSSDMSITGTSPVHYIFLPYTQGSVGGVPACTSISFAACVSMREYQSLDTAIANIEWRHTIKLGANVWKMWRRDQIEELSGGDPDMYRRIKQTVSGTTYLGSTMLRTFQTIHDLVKMEKFQSIFEKLGGSPQEFGGCIDGAIPAEVLHKGTDEEIANYQKSYPSLKRSLDRIAQYGTGTVGVITIGIISLSVCVEAVTRSPPQNKYLIFDSHNSKASSGHCTLAVASNSAVAAETIASLCSATYTNNQIYAEASMRVGSENVRGTYCVYIFPRREKK